MSAGRVAFRFDARNHEYIDLATGETFPHITGMLEKGGLVDDLWFTEESSERGTVVHKLTADYDHGALTDVQGCTSLHKGFLLAHVEAMRLIRPEILTIEEPRVHPVFRYGGRPDRTVRVHGVAGVIEIKSVCSLPSKPPKSHRIQTALQTILVAEEVHLDPVLLGRWCLYLTAKGKSRFLPCNDERDIAEAYGLIRTCTGRA